MIFVGKYVQARNVGNLLAQGLSESSPTVSLSDGSFGGLVRLPAHLVVIGTGMGN